MTIQSRTVRVFLSSTFRDFAEERDLLVRKIFPELRRKCRERQVELVDVDLRWGITEEEAQQGKVLPICMAEIDRSRPFFMGFIGERYGWVPEKEQYDLSLIMEQSWLDEHRGGKSVTELEMLHGVLNNPAMEDRSFFYFRDSAYSQAKGGAYLSEGPQENAKLEALKDRIRQSGFPVVENYRSPEDLAERVRDDLWKLIDEAFPESEVPDALARERMRHEAFTASRLGLYIGGEHYFGQIDSAMLAETRKPVLVTGDSGGGKSALLANWASRFSQNNPSAILLTHCLATGADAAQPVNMAVRILREISRIIGEELVLEGDPRKALHMLSPWLAKAGAFATQKGGFFVLVLDGLDKMDAQHDMGWWPSKLPDGVGLVASCLSGKVFDAIASRMDWEKLLVSPLQREDCERFIASHLGKYRKSLTPELTSKVLAHPLSGNPLFLRTILEELRVFGVHEELGLKLDHYLTSQTVDDLFERVLERVEADNSPESVRALLEVLWAAKESFAEDELLAVSGLPPALWAPIHIALDESLIGAGGRLAFSHDYLRKAVEDRYLPSAEDRRRIQNRMAQFCAQAMAGGRKELSPYISRHAVEHFLEVEDWDNSTAALSDLEFIEARAIAQELPAMLKDYAEAVKLLPEGEKERQTEAARQAELDRYAREMAEYSATWSRIRDGSGETEPTLPRPVKSVRLWTEEEIAAERKRMTETPNRLDIVKAFRVFIATNSAPLQQYSPQEGFAANIARNDAPAGPVHEEGKRRLEPLKCIKLIKQFATLEKYNPLSSCHLVLEGHADDITSLALSTDGRRVVSGSSDKTIRVWDSDTGECIKILNGHEGDITFLALSAYGRRIASVSSDKTIRVWDSDTGECIKILDINTEDITYIALSSDGGRVVSGSSEKSIRIWDSDTGECIKILDWHAGGISSFALSVDGRIVVSAGPEKSIRVWNSDTGDCIKILDGDEGDITSLALSADGRRVVSGSSDKTIRVWDSDTGECIRILNGDDMSGELLSLSACGCRIAASSRGENFLLIWDEQFGQEKHYLKHAFLFNNIQFSCDLNLVASYFSKEIYIYKYFKPVIEDKAFSWKFRHRRAIFPVTTTLDLHRIIFGSNNNSIQIYDNENKNTIYIDDAHQDFILSIATSRDGQIIVSGGWDGVIHIWNACNGESINSMCGSDWEINAVAISAEGLKVISGGGDGTTRIWNARTRACEGALFHENSVTAVDISDDSLWGVSGDKIGVIGIFNSKTHEVLLFKGHYGSVNSVRFSNDGLKVVSGGSDKIVRIWDTVSGKCLKVLTGHKESIESVAFTADSKSVVSVSGDNNLVIWKLDKLDEEKFAASFELKGETVKGEFIEISRDARWVVKSSGAMVRVWDIARPVKSKTIFFKEISFISKSIFSRCGKYHISSKNNSLFLNGEYIGVHGSSPSFSPDDAIIFYKYDNNTLGIFDIKKGSNIHYFCRNFDMFAFEIWKDKATIHMCDSSCDLQELYSIENLPLGPFITTAQRVIISEDRPSGAVTARPPCCGQLISIPSAIADRIEHWSNEGGEGGYTDPALLLDCPNCSNPLRLNPFFTNIEKYEN